MPGEPGLLFLNDYTWPERPLPSMWHELRVVLHNREHTLLALAIQAFSRDERMFAQAVANNWESLEAAVEGMPVDMIR